VPLTRPERIALAALPAALIFAAAQSPCAAQTLPAASPTAPGWVRPQRHFNFGGIVFDLDQGIWNYAIWWEPLRDCSNGEMHCLSSATFSVAVPRRCADLAAGHWEVGSVRTEVLLSHRASSPPLHGGGSQTNLYLVPAGHPNVLFVYDLHLGINALWWDEPHTIDFVAMQREGRLEDWLFNQRNRPAWQGRSFHRLTFEAIGACRN
jgi:hypothetical protein